MLDSNPVAEPMLPWGSSDGHVQPLQLPAGSIVQQAGTKGPCWQLIDGAVRLGHGSRHQPVRLVLPGELIGPEVLHTGVYKLDAKTLVASTLRAWPHAADERMQLHLTEALLEERQTADEQWLLRAGSADDRLKQLVYLLTRHQPQHEPGVLLTVQLPSLQDMSELLAQTIETTSRSVAKFRRQHLLVDLGQRRFHVDPVIFRPSVHAMV